MKRRAAALTVSLLLAAATALVAPPSGAATEGPPGYGHHHGGRSLIAFVSDRDSTPQELMDEVYVVNPRTRKVSRMTHNGASLIEQVPVLSPNGRRLAYVGTPYADGVADYASTAVFVCPVRTHGTRWTCGKSRRVLTLGTPSTLSWVPGRGRLLYSGYDASGTDLDVFSIRVRGGQPVNLTDEGPGETPEFDGQPSVAPDGSWFVYNHLGDLVRRDIDGSHPVPLTTSPVGTTTTHADISPDGTRLVFHSNRDGDVDVYTMAARPEGPDNVPVNLTDRLRAPDGTPSTERWASWSPDGRSIAFWWFSVLNLYDGEVYTMRADGNHVRNVTDTYPTAPDGREVGNIFPDWGRAPHHR